MKQQSNVLLTLGQQIRRKLVVHFLMLSVLASLIIAVTIQITLNVRADSENIAVSLRSPDYGIGIQESAMVNQQLVAVRNLLKSLGPQHQYYLNLPRNKDLPLSSNEPLFGIDNHGALYKMQDNGGSSLYYSGATVIGSEQRWKARNTELLDDLYRVVVDKNELVNHIYFNSWDKMSRVYPFIPSLDGHFDIEYTSGKNSFNHLAMKDNNPDKGVVWTSTYPNPFGSGTVVSAILPIYTGSFFEGVVGLNIDVNAILKVILERVKVANCHVLLLDMNDNIIIASEPVIDVLNLLSAAPKVGETGLRQNSQLSYDHSTNLRLLQWLSTRQDLLELDVGNVNFLLRKSEISETRWKLVLIQPLPKTETLFELFQRSGFVLNTIALFFVLGCGVFYITFVLRQARYFAENVIAPIRALEKWASVTLKERQLLVIESNVFEIQRALDSFKIVAKEFIDNKKYLEQAKISKSLLQKKVHLYHEMAITDPLTGIKNRKHMESVLKFQNLRGFSEACCFLLLDIDHFKRINDCFGHSSGDLVLQKVASKLSSLLRAMDVIVRWGGEEFLLFCPNTTLDSALTLAERLRFQIEQLEILPEQTITISIGVAQMKIHERAEETIARADVMLYKSKNCGRNRVTVDPSLDD